MRRALSGQLRRTAAVVFLPLALVLAACGDEGGGGSSGSGGGSTFVAASGNGSGNGSGSGQTVAQSTGADATTGSGPTTSTTTASTGGGGDAYQLCVDLINGYRAGVGSPPLARWTDAEACSNSEAQSDSETGQPHGAFGQCDEWAQNECPGWSGAHSEVITGCLELMWAEGPGGGHYENMKSTEYTRVACGFYTTPGGDVWSVQNFQ